MARPFTTARLEAFSDGVIAVIITIMVLELKVPLANGLTGLRATTPTLAVYALSFALVGIYWINHHMLLQRVEFSTSRMLRANLIWLFFLSLIPFFTAYVLEKREDSFSVSLYSASLLSTGLSFMFLRLAVNARQRRDGELEHEDRALRIKHWVSLAVYTCGVPLAFPFPLLTLYMIAFLTLLWIVPTFGAEHLHTHPAKTDEAR